VCGFADTFKEQQDLFTLFQLVFEEVLFFFLALALLFCRSFALSQYAVDIPHHLCHRPRGGYDVIGGVGYIAIPAGGLHGWGIIL